MSGWGELDDLKREAASATLEDPSASQDTQALFAELANADGSIPLTKANTDRIRAHARAAAEADHKTALDDYVKTRKLFGWSIALSRFRTADGYKWHLSAKLWPPNRSSTLHDWHKLGQIVKRLGGPPDPLIAPENASDAHHWSWIEQS